MQKEHSRCSLSRNCVLRVSVVNLLKPPPRRPAKAASKNHYLATPATAAGFYRGGKP